MSQLNTRVLVSFSLIVVFVFILAGCAAPTTAPTLAPIPTPQPSLAPTAAPAVPSPTTAPAKPAATQAPTSAPVTQAPGATATTAKAQPTGKLVAVRQEEPPTLDWKMGSEPQGFVTYSIMEGLTRTDFKTGKLAPVLAESWTWDKANTWTFNLRKGVQFHNGEPFNAAAVVYTFQRIADPAENSQIKQYLVNMDSVKALDDYTVEVKTKTLDPIFDLRTQRISIGPPKFSKENPDKLATTIIGTGPYKFVEWQKGQSFKMTANEDYWGQMPKIKDITILFRADPAVRAAMVRTGEADLAWIISPDDVSAMPKTVQYENMTSMMVRVETTGQNPALADVRVRQAMLYAVDTKTAMEKLFKNVAVQAKGNQIVVPGVLGYDPTMNPWPYDPNKAKQLLAEAKAAGVPIGTPMNFLERGTGWFPRDNEFAEYLVNSWNQVGLNVKLTVLDSGAWMNVLYAIKPEDKHGDLVYSLHDNPLMDYSRSADLYLGSWGAVSLWKDGKTDELLKAAAPLAGDERVKAYQQVSRYLEDKVPAFVFGSMIETHAINSKLQWTPRPDRVVNFWEMSFSN
jgi:peptide/nickel transport system substrate-binding protein